MYKVTDANLRDPADYLPTEVLQNILSRVGAETLEIVRKVSKDWQWQASDKVLWKHLVASDFGAKAISLKTGERDRYIDLWQAIFGTNKLWKNSLTQQLQIAAERNCARTVRRILFGKNDLNAAIKTEAVRKAAAAGALEALQALIGHETDPGSLVNPMTHWPPLFLAAKGGHIAVMEYLIQNGADVNRIRCDRTALSYAIQFTGDATIGDRMIQILLDADADVNRSIKGRPLCLICRGSVKDQERAQQLASLLIERGAKLNPQLQAGESPLGYAVKKMNGTFVEFLHSKGARVDDQLINSAIWSKPKRGVLPLLQKIAPKRLPPLIHVAVQHNAEKKIAELIGAGATLTALDSGGITPLGRGITEGVKNSSCLLSPWRLFAKPPLNTSEQGQYGLLAPHSVGFYRLLCKKGAQINQQDREGKTAFYHFVAKLCQLGDQNLLWPDSKAWQQAIGLFRELGATLFTADNHGVTPVHLCARASNLDLLEQLLVHCEPAILNAQDRSGRTPLHWATAGRIEPWGPYHMYRYGLDKNILLLVKAGANRTVIDRTGETPLKVYHRFADGFGNAEGKGNQNTVRVLSALQHNAQPRVKDQKPETARPHLAQALPGQSRSQQVVQLRTQRAMLSSNSTDNEVYTELPLPQEVPLRPDARPSTSNSQSSGEHFSRPMVQHHRPSMQRPDGKRRGTEEQSSQNSNEPSKRRRVD